MPSSKRKSRDLRTEVLESAASNLRPSVQNKRQRLSATPSETSRSRESSFLSEADFASTQFQPSGNILQTYTDTRDNNPDPDSDEDAERLDHAARDLFRRKEDADTVTNQAADCGILESVTCQDFMCHRKLDVAFGPLINFIIGHNGSGKSAVLTAITLCLGGKATSTNRGQSLRSFVREGAETAVLTVRIKNKGIGAYKRDLYGDSIVVERHFNRHGASGFKLKSKDARSIISIKRAELDDITDFFALQLDNPVNVLTQDQARQFLNSSSNVDKYRFFMKGIQLEQLDTDYSMLGEQLDNSDHALLTAADDCKAVRQKYDAAKKKLELSQKSESVRDKIRKISRQMAWVQVEDQERLLEECEQGIHDQNERVRQAETSLQNFAARFDQADQVAQEAEREVEQLKQDKQPLEESHREAKEKFEAVRKEIQDCTNNAREIKGSYDSEKKRLTETEKAIESEYQRLNDRSGGRENDKRVEIRETEQALSDVHDQGKEHDGKFQQLENDAQTAKEHCDHAITAQKRRYAAAKEAQKQLDSLRNDNRDRLSSFHPSMRNVLKAIDQERSFQNKPVGPLGIHIRNKQPQWQNMIEKTFGNLLDNFIVTSRQDQKRLSEILTRHKCPSHILVAPSNFRIAALKEPDHRFNTILRALEIDNETVQTQLVINSAIEQTILVDSQAEAIRLSENGLPTYCKAIMCPHPRERGRGFRFQQGRGGSQKMEPVDPWTRGYRMKTDDEAAIRSQEETVRGLKDDLHAAEQHQQSCEQAMKTAQQTIEQHKRRKKDLQLQSQRTEDHLADLKSELEAMQPQDGALEGLKQQFDEHKEQAEYLQQQLNDTLHEKEDIALGNRENKRALDELDTQLKNRDDAIAAAEQRIRKYKETRMRALKEKNEADHSFHDAQSDVARAEQRRNEQAEQVREWTGQAEQISARVPVEPGMSYEKMEKVLEKLHAERDRHDALAGGTREALQLEHLQAKKALVEAEDNFARTNNLVRELSKSLNDRSMVWRHFRNHITIRARLEFQHLMSKRGFQGAMKIDHLSKALSLQVDPETRGRSSENARQTKTLSGGEKSFSTVCMLLSLWEAMGSPIRCLDEFDVFMDSVNRDVSMKMMIECARQAVGRQFVLITPQSMGGVDYGPDVRVIRMLDPERGQTTLNLPGA
ncbi:MAG: hypothetical protein Q9162_002081 [Coniocarpon cinnabarinum]